MKKVSIRSQMQQLEFVRVALESGWQPDSYNEKATRHFRFFRPGGSVEISYQAGVRQQAQECLFTVGNTSTSSEKRAIELLRAWRAPVHKEPDANISHAALAAYRGLADGLSDMIEEYRLKREAIPDDYEWLVCVLLDICAHDPGTPSQYTPKSKYYDNEDCPKSDPDCYAPTDEDFVCHDACQAAHERVSRGEREE